MSFNRQLVLVQYYFMIIHKYFVNVGGEGQKVINIL